nr:PREDICTED: ubiquitin-associated domain-containing protein 1 [Bemisia tabaci]
MIAWACKKFNSGFFSDKESKNEEKSETSKHSMLAEDEPSCSQKVKLTVVGLEGHVWTLEVPVNTTVDKLKNSILSRFYNSQDSLKSSANYYLVDVAGKKVLNGTCTILEENLSDKDEILLVERNIQPKKVLPEDERGPTMEEIEKATKHLVPQNTNGPIPKPHRPSDTQNDIQRMFISLAETSSRILSANPDANEIYEVIVSKLDLHSKNAPDPQIVKQLEEMGFPKKQVIAALALKKQNATEALECLLDGSLETLKASDTSIPNSIDLDPPENANASLAEKISHLLKICITVNAKRNNNDLGNDKMLQFLVDSGLARSSSPELLSKTDSDQSELTEVSSDGSKLEERINLGAGSSQQMGLDRNDPVYKALHTNPAIILGLNNPKTLLALISIVDSPSAANLWLNDPDTSSVLNQIFKTYHTEKHAVGR